MSKFSNPVIFVLILEATKIDLAQYLTMRPTNFPFLKSKKENTITTIPKNTVQIIVTVRSQRKCNYFISFIPMKSAAESEKIIPPSSV